jgi:protein tyrosine phosphatase
MQLSVHHRDDEIKRLADQISSGTENDFANLTIRNEMNEGIIISLNQQVSAFRHAAVEILKNAQGFGSKLLAWGCLSNKQYLMRIERILF